MFDAQALVRDLARVPEEAWTDHFNMGGYEGRWRVAPLTIPEGAGHPLQRIQADGERYVDTALLAEAPAFLSVLEGFSGRRRAVRLLALAAGARIRPHDDHGLGLDGSLVRLHVPVVTHPDVRFVVGGERVPMKAGELWAIDATFTHEVVNESPVERVHFVVDVENGPWLAALLEEGDAVTVDGPPPLTDVPPILGMQPLGTLWARSARQRRGEPVEPEAFARDARVLELLGLPLGPTLQVLLGEQPDAEAFGEWVVEQRGVPSEDVVRTVNAVAGRGPRRS